MIHWIRVDDFTRAWPEGPVIVFIPNPPEMGSGRALCALRMEDGTFNFYQEEKGKPSHFFYMPPEPVA